MRRSGQLLPTFDDRAAFDWARPPSPGATDPTPILEAVRSEGDAALRRLSAQYDECARGTLRVPEGRCREALAGLDARRRAALELARDTIARVHEAQRRSEAVVEVRPGVRVWREFRPIGRVGIYAPGGRAAYPSSLLMAAVPARLAGCREVVVCSPPGPTGEPARAVLAAAALAGVDELYAVGGAQAIGALAYGTETIARVDKIFGPGGAWVNAAKLAVFGVVAIDLPAGPSEVVVWADETAGADRVAAELVAQAEHGPDSRCALALSGASEARLRELADGVRSCAARRLEALPTTRGRDAAASLRRGATVIAREERAVARWIDEMAPEHLAILGRWPERRLALVSNAGAVFLGRYSPVAGGDYCTGTNHVLPTGGRARGAGGLDLDAFGRWMSVQRLNEQGLRELAPIVETLAEWEGLPAHAAAVDAASTGGAGYPAGNR
ncbi:MAG: histidinol dehydrogenase [Gemmatimonadota bacterium]